MKIKKIFTKASILSMTLFIAGCQTSQGLYSWGGYEGALYDYYKDPAEQAALAERLLSLIEDESSKVPPGIYAEYGTLMLQQGKKDEAIKYYKKEEASWPESQHLMSMMINSLSSSQSTNKGI